MEGQGTYDVILRCCGEAVKADAEEVQRVMTRNNLSYKAQGREWIRLSHEYRDPAWGVECRRRAQEMVKALAEEKELLAVLGDSVEFASTAKGTGGPPDKYATRHFEWLGRQKKVPVEVVRDGIERLARSGFISIDMAQQEALRRGLGITSNATERSERAPWVYWLGGDNGLHYLVTSLWNMGLIYCSGGERDKWEVVCGVFCHCDGEPYLRERIKCCYCHNPRKRKAIDEAILDGLKFLYR